jgi:tetratricopeptide (TPR) repeat protein
VDETPSSPQPAILVPVSADDFARGKRRVVLAWVGGALLAVLLGTWFYRRSADPVEAQQYLDAGQRLLKVARYPEAIIALDHAISLQGNLAEAYLRRGRAKVANGDAESALGDFTKFLQLRPGNAEALVERAAAYLRKEDYNGVLADTNQALAWDPKLSYAYNLRGTAFRALGNLPQSVEAFSRAVELAPDLDNYFQRASTYQLMGEHRLALSDLDQVIALYPSSPMGYFARAKSREAIGDSAGARGDRETGRILEDRKPGQ